MAGPDSPAELDEVLSFPPELDAGPRADAKEDPRAGSWTAPDPLAASFTTVHESAISVRVTKDVRKKDEEYADELEPLGRSGRSTRGKTFEEWQKPKSSGPDAVTVGLKSSLVKGEHVSKHHEWIMCGVLGVLTGLTNLLIDVAIGFLSGVRYGTCGGRLTSLEHCCGDDPVDWVNYRCVGSDKWTPHANPHLTYVIVSVALCIVASLIVWRVPQAAGSGVPEMKTVLGGFCMHGVLSYKTLVAKSLGLICGVSAGMPLGKEGPLVQLSCCWAHLLCKALPQFKGAEGQLREMLSAAAAAGVAAAFGAPLGGVLFSLEEVSHFFPAQTLWRSFFAAVMSAATLQFFRGEQITQFAVTYGDYKLAREEYLACILLGFTNGLLGGLFVKINCILYKFRKRKLPRGAPQVAEVAFAAAVCALIHYEFDLLRPVSTRVIGALIAPCSSEDASFGLCTGDINAELLLCGFLRYGLTIWCFGSCLPGGIFVQSIFLGACSGRFFGQCVYVLNTHWQWTDRVEPGVYALIGATGMLCGIARISIALVVIMFELTGTIGFAVPCMLCVVSAKLIADRVSPGLYTQYVKAKGFVYEDLKKTEISFHQRVMDFMEDQVVMLSEDMPMARVQPLLEQHTFDTLPLVDEQTHKLLGIVNRDKALSVARSYVHASEHDVARFGRFHCGKSPCGKADGCDFAACVSGRDGNLPRGTVAMIPETPVEQVHNVFRQLKALLIIVLEDDKVVGVVTRHHFLQQVKLGRIFCSAYQNSSGAFSP